MLGEVKCLGQGHRAREQRYRCEKTGLSTIITANPATPLTLLSLVPAG